MALSAESFMGLVDTIIYSNLPKGSGFFTRRQSREKVSDVTTNSKNVAISK